MDNVIVDTDIEYEFNICESLKPDYRVSNLILSWLKENLESLTDDNNRKIFSKVNHGYNEDTLKNFGNRPVANIHINNYEYSDDLDMHRPSKVNTVILFFLKGANNTTYVKLTELHDYLLQEFITNNSFKQLDDIVLDTYITNSELSNQPISKKWGSVGGFELSHILY